MRGFLMAAALLGAAFAASGCASVFANSRCPMEGPDGGAYDLVIEGSAESSDQAPDVDVGAHLADAYVLVHPDSYPALPSIDESLDANGCGGVQVPGPDTYRLIVGLTVWTGSFTFCHWTANDEFDFDDRPKVLELSLVMENCGHYDCWPSYFGPSITVDRTHLVAGETLNLSVGPVFYQGCGDPAPVELPGESFQVYLRKTLVLPDPGLILLANATSPANLTLPIDRIGSMDLEILFDGDSHKMGPRIVLNVSAPPCPDGLSMALCSNVRLFEEDAENGTENMYRSASVALPAGGGVQYPDETKVWDIVDSPSGTGHAWWSGDAVQWKGTLTTQQGSLPEDGLGHYARFQLLAPEAAKGSLFVEVRGWLGDETQIPLTTRGAEWQTMVVDLEPFRPYEYLDITVGYTTGACDTVPCTETGVWVDDIEVV